MSEVEHIILLGGDKNNFPVMTNLDGEKKKYTMCYCCIW